MHGGWGQEKLKIRMTSMCISSVVCLRPHPYSLAVDEKAKQTSKSAQASTSKMSALSQRHARAHTHTQTHSPSYHCHAWLFYPIDRADGSEWGCLSVRAICPWTLRSIGFLATLPCLQGGRKSMAGAQACELRRTGGTTKDKERKKTSKKQK